MPDNDLTDEELLELDVDPDFDTRIDRWMRALYEWRNAHLPYGSRRAGILEAFTSTYWMFRMGPCHSWWFGKAFPYGAANMWRKRHPVLWRYFHIIQAVCKWLHARRDREWEREVERRVLGRDFTDG